MLLFKCKCGCIFTVKEDSAITDRGKKLCCQNCDSYIVINDHMDLETINTRCEENEMKISVIPENAEISVNFKI